jgi:hypothetical protein
MRDLVTRLEKILKISSLKRSIEALDKTVNKNALSVKLK